MLLTVRVVVDRELVADRMTLLIEDPCFDLAVVARPVFHILPGHDDEAVIGPVIFGACWYSSPFILT